MDRPGPLHELPLKLFLPGPNSNNKRPLSPPAPSLQFAKRRILDNTGTSTRIPRFAEPVDYASVLNGPDSPARVLDFSGAKQVLRLTPRSKRPQDVQLTPSPKLRAQPSPKPGSSSTMTPGAQDHGPSSSTRRHAEIGASMHPLAFDVVPREIPPPTDPESVHYPGFDVYRDPHCVVVRRDETRTIEALVDPEEEPEKENTVPPREIRKISTVLADIHTKPASPSKGKHRMTADSHSHLPANHRRIFGNGFEDAIVDLSASYGGYRRSHRPLELLDDSEALYSSPLWQAYSGSGLVG